ncbi:MFS transporter [Sphingomonas sp. JC676]|uniref:MFS transporter n=1 Tax=Sphingomonas sp. JC676 TaxID=2768065 RepID=UPI001657CCD8|nr:MFS transporter [Sphingomonas sp. JC676]MBC9035054.1 MFS transporter [Sphingomonas sp. JC676]
MTTSIGAAADAAGATASAGRYRWVICALLFASTTLCYMDRQIFGLLKPTLDLELGWSETVYGDVIATFSLMYACGYLFGGRLMDRIGVRRGLSLAVAGWSISAALHGLMTTALGFKFARGALGLTEGGNFPASIKAVREWFPPRERAFATGLFNAGSNIGAIVTPISLPFVVALVGWRAAFVLAGALGLIWVALWLRFYETPARRRRLSAAELAYIRSGDGDAPEPAKVPWLSLFAYRGTWAYALGMLLTSPVWWFYLNWVPGFLHQRFGVNMMASIAPLVTIYLIADIGSVAGGWISSRLIRGGMPVLRARMIAMLCMAVCPIPVALVSGVSGMWPAVLLIALAAAGHQGLSANLYTIVSDTLPAGAVSSVIGIGGFAAGVTGMFVAMAVGRILDATGGNYMVLFIGAAAAYPLAVLVMALILRRPSPPAGTSADGLRPVLMEQQ